MPHCIYQSKLVNVLKYLIYRERQYITRTLKYAVSINQQNKEKEPYSTDTRQPRQGPTPVSNNSPVSLHPRHPRAADLFPPAFPRGKEGVNPQGEGGALPAGAGRRPSLLLGQPPANKTNTCGDGPRWYMALIHPSHCTTIMTCCSSISLHTFPLVYRAIRYQDIGASAQSMIIGYKKNIKVRAVRQDTAARGPTET